MMARMSEIKAASRDGRIFLQFRHPAPHQVELTATEAVALAMQFIALSSVRLLRSCSR